MEHRHSVWSVIFAVLFPAMILSADDAPKGEARAWIRFEKAAESYAGTPYIFLGKEQIDLKIDVKPAENQVLDLLCSWR